ncbi:GNAT family N-acetyltransferase [Streptomyces sp. NBC_00102]|uniref:GNAT family N-acetyltransferase n=1 Tax=Streptomyces sp. NBC_00102 TaxID=2975652 RepID=UPI002253C735|nr:GNAT family N-acetyltransferase [Streptomyces sp. NBC_00102]MCX5396588.1 GNAT family N-acetyltransferase [Streptomyces sp. NBC_00102]
MQTLRLHAIRPALLSDGAALAALDRETWSTLHSVQPRPQPPYPPFFDERHSPRDFLVAETAPDGERAAVDAEETAKAPSVAGYIRLVAPTPLACNQHVRQIQGLAVAATARGLGIGRSLLRAAVTEARRQGANRITLRVLGHNEPARALYASEGFAVEGVLPGEFFLAGGYVDDVLMGRAL